MPSVHDQSIVLLTDADIGNTIGPGSMAFRQLPQCERTYQVGSRCQIARE